MAIDTVEGEDAVGTLDDRPVPSGCLGPIACRALGVCGRLACTTNEERLTFEVAAINAPRRA